MYWYYNDVRFSVRNLTTIKNDLRAFLLNFGFSWYDGRSFCYFPCSFVYNREILGKNGNIYAKGFTLFSILFFCCLV